MAVLHYQRSGSGVPLVILHGLFGTLENWNSITRQLSEHFDVIAVDLRNHGRSFHGAPHHYEAMTSDVLQLLASLGLDRVHLMGHSMGGKVAMQFAMQHPQYLHSLCVVDIAPVQYPRHHDDVLTGLAQIEVATLKSRSQADQQLAEYVSDAGVRQFLLKNLYRSESGSFAWRFNLEQITQDYDWISRPPAGEHFSGKTLFIKGENSHYLTPAYTEAVTSRFSQVDFRIIQGAGHWPHAEKPEVFLGVVMRFLKGVDAASSG